MAVKVCGHCPNSKMGPSMPPFPVALVVISILALFFSSPWGPHITTGQFTLDKSWVEAITAMAVDSKNVDPGVRTNFELLGSYDTAGVSVVASKRLMAVEGAIAVAIVV